MPSLSGFSRALVLDRIRSRRMPGLLAATGALAWVAIGLSGLPWAATVVLAGLVVVIAGGILLHADAGFRPGGSRAVTALAITPAGEFLLAIGDAGCPDLPVTPDRHWILPGGMSPGLAIGLELVDADGCRFRLILFRDQCDPVTWRRLIVRLRLVGGSTTRNPLP